MAEEAVTCEPFSASKIAANRVIAAILLTRSIHVPGEKWPKSMSPQYLQHRERLEMCMRQGIYCNVSGSRRASCKEKLRWRGFLKLLVLSTMWTTRPEGACWLA